MKGRRVMIALWVATALALVAAIPFVQMQRDMRRIAPPEQVTDVDTFLAWRPQTESFIILQSPEGDHIMATGASRQFASGPSAYIFSRRGSLVDWAHDIGDEPRFDKQWRAQQSLHKGLRLAPSEIRDWLEQN
jgi:hypothetical protein